MQLKLLSDYTQHYDSLFDERPVYTQTPTADLLKYLYAPYYNLKDGDTFVRLCNAGINPSRSWCFDFMQRELGENVVPYGPAGYMAEKYGRVVVYTDEHLHAGRGKFLVGVNELFDHWLELTGDLASAYIETDPKIARSRKYLQIGTQAFSIEVTSQNDWRTNAGQIECTVLDHWTIQPDERSMHRCLWAIDYVTDMETGIEYAIDYNMAPGVAMLGVKDYLSSSQIVNALKDWYRLKGLA